MAFISSKDCGTVFVGAAATQSVMGGITMKRSVVVDERRFLGSTWPTNLDTGIRNGELTFADVIYDTDINPLFLPLPTTYSIVSACIEGDTAGKRFWGFQSAAVSGGEVQLSPDKMHNIAPEFTVRGEVNVGYVLAPNAARTTDNNTQASSVDMGASATSGHAFLHVPAISGGGSCLITVQTSTNNSVWVDHTAFAAVTTTTSQVIALPSTVNQYLAVKWAWTGGSDNSITFFVGVAVD